MVFLPLGPHCGGGHTRSSVSIGALVWVPVSSSQSEQMSSSYLAPGSVLIQLQPFLGSSSTALFPFLNIYLRSRPNYFHFSRPYAVSPLPLGAPLKSPSLFSINLFFGPFSLTLHPDGFLSYALPISANWNASTERLVAPSPAASHPPLSTSFLLLSDSRSVLATLSFPPSFFLPQTLRQIWQKLLSHSSCSITLQWVSEHSFLPGNDAADDLARRGALLAPSAIPCSLSHTHSSFFSDWRRTVSSKFFDTQVPLTFTVELVLPRHAGCVLSRLRCNGHSLLLISYLFRIGRIENPSCSACGHPSQNISQLILHCQATDSLRLLIFGDSLSLYDLWSRPWRVARLLGLRGLPPCPHPSERVG